MPRPHTEFIQQQSVEWQTGIVPVDGDIHMCTGVMTAGAYFWRPPHIEHGPTGSRAGFTALFRAKEGRFETEWSEPDQAIPWDRPYTPILPT